MARARSVTRGRKGPCVEYPPTVSTKINAMIAESNEKEDDKYWQWVWLLILEACFVLFCPQIKNIAICAFLITVFCYPSLKKGVNNKNEITPIVADKEVELTLTVIKQKNPWSMGPIGETIDEKYVFKVYEKDLNSISLKLNNYHPNVQNPYCCGSDYNPDLYENCEIVSGDKVLFRTRSLYCRTQIIVKKGNESKALLNEFVY